ncbi:ABC transporter ATP-binding protein [Salipiger aestuarii]|uniref:Branched-chain amino acid transport system ATP-binding protein n=1 Tax=Salipiger aestuarii TaxID=568098 RepID=A0A327YSK7_9RHOB|nr:ABC transporter ATP-binding protein [Salipiger aestuarii]EIE51190.1 ABC transporter-like protein [Citreicella sp. 357]KAA8605188.1 ABC transporter ATP-binding protein [Salipiger aestuarii]KAA8607261.1 ABC transporter ATP-binding protein [Salipiger aestuarii]KAB2538424.1 ABC transporter ATP-binding protein [Salipiger aestuarii]RAK23913.1 branched-chain amino acid transport system ATP-binding protein [Salipiger aestuarii]
MTLLSLTQLTASYGATQALFGVDLDIAAGEAVAMMGRNGMGKTTTVRCICRMMPAQGTLVFDGQDLSRLPSHRAARLGIGLVPEGRRCFRDLSVAENLVAAARPGAWHAGRVERLFPRLGERRRQRAASLSGGEQQMLAIGRALMTNPRMLILDEATEGLAPTVRAEIWAAIATLKADGMAMLVIDKSLKELRGACDRAVILERGRSVWAGPMRALTTQVANTHLGL